MRAYLRIIWSDFNAIRRVCGLRTATRWLFAIVRKFGECRASGTLGPADMAMGDGPFRASLRGVSATMMARKAFANIREIWARDAYLGGGFLSIGANDVVVDLGANTGIFTALALAHHPTVRVVAVEPNASLNDEFRRNLQHAGSLDRATLMRCFLGGKTDFQEQSLIDPECRDVPFISEADFLKTNRITKIDFLKCDIEGSEFELLTPHSAMLAMTRQLAVELHDQAGDRQKFIAMLRDLGFETRIWREAPNDCIVLAKRG